MKGATASTRKFGDQSALELSILDWKRSLRLSSGALAVAWNGWLGTMFTKDDFLFLGPRHRFYLCFSNKGLGTRQAFLLI